MENLKRVFRKNGVLILFAVVVLLAAAVAAIIFAAAPFGGKDQPAADSGVPGYPEEYQAYYAKVWQKNPDFKGYLTLEGTSLATTVVQTTDNVTYTQKNFDGAEGATAFMDYRCDMTAEDSHLLIYLPSEAGQQMYSELTNYKRVEYYQKHPIITFNSVLENARYKVFAVVIMEADSDLVPYQTCLEGNDRDAKVKLVQMAMEHSLLQVPVGVFDKDELLTIHCEDPSLKDAKGQPAQMLIFTKKIRSDEPDTVDTSSALMNPNKSMPKEWYEQILREQNVSTVHQQIREEAADWFTEYELSQIADADLERLLNERKAEMKKYLNEQELLLSAQEKLYLYEKRKEEAENPVLKLDIQSLIARVGDQVKLNVTRTPADKQAVYTWTSSDDSIVSVSGNGAAATINAKKQGNATVTVTCGKSSAVCKIEVKAAETFVVNPSAKTVTKGDYFTINASSKIAKATSSDTNVAKVTYGGNVATVTGSRAGTATITVTGVNGLSATCKVTVEDYRFSIDKTSMKLERGTRGNLTITNGEAVNWYTGNSKVAKVHVVKSGKVAQVEAVGTGTTTITATARNGAQVSCKVTVTDNSIAISTGSMELRTGDIGELRVTRGSIYKWTSTDESVIRVYSVGDGSYAQVEAVGPGYAKVLAEGADGSTAVCKVTVTKPMEALSISPYSMTLKKGDLRNITVTSGSPANWVSLDPTIAEVFVVGDGTMAQVEGKRAGTTAIWIYDYSGNWVTCTVTVEETAAPLVIGPGTVHMEVGDWVDLSVTSGYAVDWSTTDSSVVRVYGNDDTSKVRIKGEGPGKAQVVAYAKDGSTAVCNVTVNAPAAVPLTISPGSMRVVAGDWHEIRVTCGTAVDWKTSDAGIVRIYSGEDENSIRIKGENAGTAQVTAYAADGSTAACYITVDPYIPEPQPQALTLAPESITLVAGDWGEVKVSTGQALTWETSDASVVRIFSGEDSTSVRIKGENAGTARVTAYGAGGTSATCYVTVNPYIPEPVPQAEPETQPQTEPQPQPETQPETQPPAPALKLSPEKMSLMEGDWGEVKVTSGQALKWETSDAAVVRIYSGEDDTSVRIKAEAAGTAKVVAYGADGVSVFCTITVTPYTEG